jgi:hypothetical protein
MFEASAVLHELSRIHYMDLTASERKNVRYRRIKKSGRSDPAPTFTAPFPFMVDREWVASVWDGQHAEYVRSWASYSNPPGFEGEAEFEVKEKLVDVEEEDEEDDNEEASNQSSRAD